MLEKTGDIWTARRPGDYVVVTTNMTLRTDGGLVMGRGIAREAAQRYPGLQKDWGNLLKAEGAKVHVELQTLLIMFPVKYEFYHRADINLILKSTLQLLALFPTLEENSRVLLGRPGCGNGKLDWAEVRPMLMHYLTDDRFVVFSK